MAVEEIESKFFHNHLRQKLNKRSIENINVKQIRGITEERGCKQKHEMAGEFMSILDDILGEAKRYSLGGYVKRVKAELERKGFKESGNSNINE